jgi:2-C-methyl-D-erythritol 2,4-cyclodiphosphate synthase
MTPFRVGLGQDSHRFSADADRPLRIGGIVVPGARGLDGNSDADVVLHALCRALEQAIGIDEFSDYADAMSRNGVNDSREYVRYVLSRVEQSGYRVNNVGLTIEGRTPRIAPLRAALTSSIAALLHVETDAVGISASTGEDLTAFGRGEGIQAFAIVSVVART